LTLVTARQCTRGRSGLTTSGLLLRDAGSYDVYALDLELP
jgi:hypothetical protein